MRINYADSSKVKMEDATSFLETFIDKQRVKSQRQTTLTDFFTSGNK